MYDHNATLKMYWDVISHWMDLAEHTIKKGNYLASKCDFISTDFLDAKELIGVCSQKYNIKFMKAKSDSKLEFLVFIEKGKDSTEASEITKHFCKLFFNQIHWQSRVALNSKWEQEGNLKNLVMVETVLTNEDCVVLFVIPVSSLIALSHKFERSIIKEGYAYLMEDGEIMVCERINSDTIIWSWSTDKRFFQTSTSQFIPGFSLGYVGSIFSEFETSENNIVKLAS